MTPKKLKRRLLAAIILAIITLTISPVLDQKATAQENDNIIIQDFALHPENQTITKGNKIVWINNDPVIYTLYFMYEANHSTYTLSDPIPPGQSWSHIFNGPTKLEYRSLERVWITGRLRIVKILGDINWDGTVNIYDLYALGKAYQTTTNSPNWNEDADIDFNGIVNKADLEKLSENYGKTDP